MSDELTEDEAKTIAHEIDAYAGGFFQRCLVRAALKGAEAQRRKIDAIPGGEGGSWAELRERFNEG
jgi:hypothetical protein